MKDRILDHIWSKQKEFNKNFVDLDNLSYKESQEWTKEYVLHMISETNSLLDEVNWKMHHKDDTVCVNRRELLLEWIDVFKYWLSIGLVWGITPEEFYRTFDEKSSLVEHRFLQEFSSREDKDVVVCDIDGVLGDYPKTFLRYVYRREIEKGRSPSWSPDDIVYNLDLYQHLETYVSTEDLREYKIDYRSSGEIRSESPIEGSVEFLEELHRRDYYVVLLTSRPFDRHKNLYIDTYIWLKSQGFKFDMLLNDSKKRDKITKLSEDSRIRFIVDDDPKIIDGLLGIDSLTKIYIIDRSYNKDYEVRCDKVERVVDFNEILESEERS